MFRPTLICAAVLFTLQTPTAVLAQPVAASAAAEQPLAARIDAAIAGYYKADEPGATVIVTRDGKTLFRKAYGLASTARGTPLTPDMTLRIGSVTKQFTAAAILMLAEEGKLRLDDDITAYLPGYPTHGEKITVEHLLTHTSGIPSYTGKTDFNASRHLDATPAQLIEVFKNDPLEFKPGTRWKYNNSGYLLLGAIIEKISGMPYGDFIQQRIFTPLGMAHSAYEGREARKLDYAAGHAEAERKIVPSSPLSPSKSYAGGALASTADDLARWDAAIAAGKLLKPASWQRAFTEYKLADGRGSGYGYGWEIGKLQGLDMAAHGGSTNGFSTYVLRIPQEKLYVAVLSNAEYGVVQPDVVGSKAAAIAAGKPYPEFRAIALAPEKLAAFAGTYKFADGVTRTVSVEDGRVWMMRAGRTRLPLLPHAENGFFIDRSLTHLEFGRDEHGKVVRMTMFQDGQALVGQRAAALSERKSIVLPAAQLATYEGQYQMAPGFVLTVRRDGEQLSGQATGQPALNLLASAEDVFFVRQIDANVRFVKGADGKIEKLLWSQGGRERPAPKLP